MKRKWAWMFLVIGSLLLVGCSNEEDKNTLTTEAQEIDKTEERQKQIEWQAEIKQDAIKSDETIMILIHQIEPVMDQENVVDMVGKGELQLNISIDQLKGQEVSDFTKGKTVRVILEEHPIMTNSLPPQIPGNSIKEISLVE